MTCNKIHDVSQLRWVVLFLGWFIYFSFGMIVVSISPLMTPIIRDLNLTYSQAGFILGAWQLTYLAAAFAAGFLTDRAGIYFSLAFGTIVISISAALRGFATNFETMFLAVAVFGIGGPMISIGSPKLVASFFRDKERGTAMGIHVTGAQLGMAVSVAIANSILLPLLGTWRKALSSFALCGVLALIVWLFVGRRINSLRKPQKSVAQNKSSQLKGISVLFKSRNVWLIVIIGFSAFFMSHGLGNWLPQLLEFKGENPATAGVITSIFTILRTLSVLFMPRLSYSRLRKHLVILVLLTGCVSTLSLTSSGLLFWIGLIINGLICGGFVPLMMVYLVELPEVGSEYAGTASGMYFTVGEVGGFSAPLLMGNLRDLTGSFSAGLTMFALLMALMIPLAFMLSARANSLHS